jgi:tetratricopeptide (TPR) repeat protein
LEPLYLRALAIRERSLGAEHPDVAASLDSLAEIQRDKGRFDEAEQLYKRALAIRENKLGPAHPEVARSLTNLAETCFSQRRYSILKHFIEEAC